MIIEFTLRQHTPLIHFQHGQQEATLRASEVKPKLDNFIFKQLLAEKRFESNAPPSFAILAYGENVSNEFSNWLVGSGKSEHAALDYQLLIKSVPEQVKHYHIGKVVFKKGQKVWEHQFPAFFANMGKGEQVTEEFRFFSYTESPIECVIRCLNPKVLDYFQYNEGGVSRIQLILQEFFMTHNFGMRQSKGFGSFSLDEFQDTPVLGDNSVGAFHFNVNVLKTNKEKDEEGIFAANKYTDVKSQQHHSNWYNLFEHIDLLYRTLRSGINLPNDDPSRAFYFKSLMFHWSREREEQWDKKTIRFMLFGGGNGKDAHHEYTAIKQRPGRMDYDSSFGYLPRGQREGQGEHLLRDMLGLASEQEWGKYKSTVKKSVKDNEQNELARFKSPLTFKPIFDKNTQEWTISIIVSEIPAVFLNANVDISAAGRGRSIQLKTPAQFSVRNYLRWAIEFVNDSDAADLVGKGQERHKDLKKIQKIYEQLNQDRNE